MATLDSKQRRLLESTVIKARNLAERGAVKALQNLAVDQPEPFHHMSPPMRDLRRRLRAKARLLGDENTNGKQEMVKISYELAYEYWHKMLFARFLEANHLLIHLEHNISVSLEECGEFATEEGHADKWTAAAHYASHMLPAIFRPEDPLMQVEFATEDRLALECLLEGIEEDIFLATDSLGWVYQYWQSEAKAAINASGEKINGQKLPAVTQLFTEPYMVHFLIDNTIGAWWSSRNPGKQPPVDFEYMRKLDDGTPAAGRFEGWPETVKEVTTLDPCMGSGHFIVELFNVLAPLRIVEEELSKEEATRKVIAENLHGLEIDPRCTQIAAFNLALTAWKFCGHYMVLPEMNLACSGLAPKGKKEDWIKLVSHQKDPVQRTRMENGMEVLYDHFQLAPELGSLLDPSTIKPDIYTASFDELQPVLMKALAIEEDKDVVERGVMAAGIAKAGQLLAKKYVLQITNVPYLTRGKHGDILKTYCENNYSKAKNDLANVFLEKILKSSNGTVTCVIPQNWLFLTTYKKHREDLLKKYTWNFVAPLGPGAFSQISGEVVKAILFSLHSLKPTNEVAFAGIDVSEHSSAFMKDNALKSAEIKQVNQLIQLKNPDVIISIDKINIEKLLGNCAKALAGIDTGDGNRFKFKFHELPIITSEWIVQLNSFDETNEFSGREHILLWQEGKGDLLKVPGASIRNVKYWGKNGVYVVRMAKTPSTLSYGEAWDRNGALLIPYDEENLLPIWVYTKSNDFRQNVRKINQKLSVSEATFERILFDLEYWQKVAAEKYPNGLPKPYSDDPTQWLFHGHPKYSDNPLQVAVSRLLGYRWPAETDREMELDDKAREYIREVWGSEWDNNTLTTLLKKEGSGKTNLEQWLREEFFMQHCKVFNNRPFIWHIWDGRKDGFAALFNYHKLSNANMKKLIYTYLNDSIRRCEMKVRDNESGADGVRLNIYPFMQAGILRKNPNIKWGKDRGKNPEGSPWGPDRHNRYEDLDEQYKLKDEKGNVI